MTFTQYLCDLIRRGRAPSFWACIEHDAWPERSARLEDYESFLRRYFGAAQRDLVPELRALWAEAEAETNTDGRLDLALAGWRDYALHLRDCELVRAGGCPRAEELLAMALAGSRFQDLERNEPDPIPCEDPDDAELRRRIDRLADQVLELSDVEAFVRFHTSPIRSGQ